MKILSIKFATTFLLALITFGFTWSKADSQIQTRENRQQTVSIIVEKAPIKCNVEAYRAGFASDEPKTSTLRTKPNKNSAIVKTITTKDEVVYSISGSDGKGWFEVSKIQAVSDVEETLFEGHGWIHSSQLDMSIAASDAKLRAAPQKNSRVLKKLIPDESESRPLTCKGKWMRIKSGRTIGWLSPEGQCANPLTTCS
jgi:SH3-like domain-containing protein